VPEGDTIFRAAAALRVALVGKRLVALEVRRDPRGQRAPEAGTEITAVDANGKHLLVHFGDGQVLHTHMQMTGAWHVYRPGERWRRPGHTARVVMRVDDGTTAVCFAAPIVELRREGERDRSTRATRMLERLGPDLCVDSVDFDDVLARLAALPRETELGAALLDQLHPYSDRADAERELADVAEAMEWLRAAASDKPPVSFGGLHDLRHQRKTDRFQVDLPAYEKNLEAILEAGGGSLADIVKTTVFLADMAEFRTMNEVYAKMMKEPYPSRSTVAVRELPLSARVEIEAWAFVA